MCSTVFKLACGLALSCCKRKVFFSGNSSLQLSHSRDVAVRVDGLSGFIEIETLFISWCDSCAWTSGTWLVFHVAVATAETRHPPPHCANVHCLVSVNVQQASMNVFGCNFFPHGGIRLYTFASYALPCQTSFCQTAPLLPSVARRKNLTEYWREGSTSTAIPPTSASDVVGQRNKIGGFTFGAALVVRKSP